MNRDGSSRLAAAVIKSALEDMDKTLRKLRENPDNAAVRAELESIRDFFSTSWFETLCALCGMESVYIRERLKLEDCNDK